MQTIRNQYHVYDGGRCSLQDSGLQRKIDTFWSSNHYFAKKEIIPCIPSVVSYSDLWLGLICTVMSFNCGLSAKISVMENIGFGRKTYRSTSIFAPYTWRWYWLNCRVYAGKCPIRMATPSLAQRSNVHRWYRGSNHTGQRSTARTHPNRGEILP